MIFQKNVFSGTHLWTVRSYDMRLTNADPFLEVILYHVTALEMFLYQPIYSRVCIYIFLLHSETALIPKQGRTYLS